MIDDDYATPLPRVGDYATRRESLPYEYHTTPVARAGFGRRAIAWLLDLLIVDGLYLVFFAIGRIGLRLGLHAAGTTAPSMDLIADLLTPYAILWVVLYVVYVGFFTRSGGQTPGKMLLGIRVVHRDGRDPTISQAWFRPLGYAVSGLPFGLGFLLAVVPPRKVALHDLLTGTRVVRSSHES